MSYISTTSHSVVMREYGFTVENVYQRARYLDSVIPLAEAVADGKVTQGIAICGSGVGACVAANKVRGVRAALSASSVDWPRGQQ